MAAAMGTVSTVLHRRRRHFIFISNQHSEQKVISSREAARCFITSCLLEWSGFIILDAAPAMVSSYVSEHSVSLE